MADKTQDQDTTEDKRAEDDKPLTRKAAQEMTNAAISGHLSRYAESNNKRFAEAINEALRPLAEKLSAFEERFTKPVGADQKEPAGKQPDVEVLKLTETVQSLKRTLAEKDAAEKERNAQERVREQKEALREALGKVGVQGPRARAAVALLHDADGRITRNEENHVVMTFKRSGYTEALPLDKAIAEWVQTDDGKEFLPPTGAGGSGSKDSPVDLSRRPRDKQDKVALAKARLAAAHGLKAPSK